MHYFYKLYNYKFVLTKFLLDYQFPAEGNVFKMAKSDLILRMLRLSFLSINIFNLIFHKIK